jgi:hypothetical protein
MRRFRIGLAIGSIVGACSLAQADFNSVDANGVNAVVTGLTGTGVKLGQVEPGRPARNTPDTNGNENSVLNIAGLYSSVAGHPGPNHAWADFRQDDHAQSVAGNMISTGGLTRGVAPGATLHSGDTFSNAAQMPAYVASSLVTQRIARLPGMAAVNLSFGTRLPGGLLYGQPGAILDGNSLYSRFLDWSGPHHQVLYTIAGNETGGSFGFNVPTDTFNGLVVGATTTSTGAVGGVYDRMASFNVTNQLPNGGGQAGRRTIDIVAPGDHLEAAGFGNFAVQPIANGNGSGTSFAAPHVAGAAALLYERSTGPNGNALATLPLVSKAIILNSADKIRGVLDMDRTILRGTVATNNAGGTDATGAGNNWLQQRNTEAGRDFVPLDSQLGVGQLNVRRMIKQFEGGYQPSGGSVGPIGWDLGVVATGDFQRYTLPPLQANDFLSATLTWYRHVELQENLTVVRPGGPTAVGVDGEFSAEAYVALNNTGTAPLTPGAFNFAPGDALVDLNGNNTYDAGMTESFAPRAGGNIVAGLSDLDLYVLPVGWTSLADAVMKSISVQYSLEHIFAQIPTSGQYELVVHGWNAIGGADNYGLAWWTVPEPTSMLVIGGLATLVMRRR